MLLWDVVVVLVVDALVLVVVSVLCIARWPGKGAGGQVRAPARSSKAAPAKYNGRRKHVLQGANCGCSVLGWACTRQTKGAGPSH